MKESSRNNSLSLMWKPQTDYIEGVTFQPTNWVELEQLANCEILGCIPAAGVGLENMEEQLDVKSSELFQDPDPYTFIGILREEIGKEERKKPK